MPMIPLALLGLLVFIFPVAMIVAIVVLLVMVIIAMYDNWMRSVSSWVENKFFHEREENPDRLTAVENWCILICIFLAFVILQLLVFPG